MPTVRAGDGTNLYFVTDGGGSRTPIVLVHGLFCSYRLYDRLTRRLPDRLVIRPDVRGHGKSDRPLDPDCYRWSIFGDDVVAVLDELDIEKAVIGGLSLGANIALSVGERHLDRCAGLIVEMPVLGDGRLSAERTFPPILRYVSRFQRPLGPPTSLFRALPPLTCQPELGLLKDVFGINLLSMAALEGGLLHSDEPFPADDPALLHRIDVPTLVIGHHFDGLHAITDARVTADCIEGAELVETTTIADLRLRQKRYAEIHNDWLDRHDL